MPMMTGMPTQDVLPVAPLKAAPAAGDEGAETAPENGMLSFPSLLTNQLENAAGGGKSALAAAAPEGAEHQATAGMGASVALPTLLAGGDAKEAVPTGAAAAENPTQQASPIAGPELPAASVAENPAPAVTPSADAAAGDAAAVIANTVDDEAPVTTPAGRAGIALPAAPQETKGQPAPAPQPAIDAASARPGAAEEVNRPVADGQVPVAPDGQTRPMVEPLPVAAAKPEATAKPQPEISFTPAESTAADAPLPEAVNPVEAPETPDPLPAMDAARAAYAAAAKAEAGDTQADDSPVDLKPETAAAPQEAVRPAPAHTTHAAAKTTPQTADPAETRAAVRTQVVRHVAANLASVAGRETMTLQLNPEHLGRVEISFSGRDDQLSVVIQASGQEAEQAIREGLKELADGIVERTGRWQQVDIRVENRAAEDRRDGQPRDAGRDEERRDGGRRHDGNPEDSGDGGRSAREWAAERTDSMTGDE